MMVILLLLNLLNDIFLFQLAKIPLSSSQVDALINFIDMDGDGDIDFRSVNTSKSKRNSFLVSCNVFQ